MTLGAKKKITVLICDDHALFREGVKTILCQQPDIEVIGEAENGLEAVEKGTELAPDVTLMDISMPGLRGFDATRRIRKVRPDAKILILTVYDDEEMVTRCLDSGAAGYILKDSPLQQLVYAIHTVHSGQQFLSPKVLTGVVRHYMQQPPGQKGSYKLLTDREREILVLLAEANSIKEIAGRLNLSVKTVDAHKVNLMRKLDLHDRAQLIRYAVRNKLIEV